MNLSTCNIGGQKEEPGIQALAVALSTNATITDLNLAANKIDTEGAELLAPAIANNQVIQFLDLSENKIGIRYGDNPDAELGVAVFASALAANRTITELSLAKNHLDTKCVRVLASAILDSAATSVNLSDNNIEVALRVDDSVPQEQEQYLGLYELRSEAHGDKPVYMHTNQQLSCYFVGSFWMFGKELGKDDGYFMIREDSATPDAATQPLLSWTDRQWKAVSAEVISSADGHGNVELSAVPSSGFVALCNAIQAQNGATPPGSGVVQMGPIRQPALRAAIETSLVAGDATPPPPASPPN